MAVTAPLNDDATIRRILLETRRIAVVGASDRPSRPSFGVTGFLVGRGFDVTPVNPTLDGRPVQGVASVATLEEAAPLDMVDVFRRSAEAGQVVDEAIRLGARTVWLQLGVIDRAAAERARAAGVEVVMDRCPVIEWRRLGLPLGA
ncbi:CoA-binding protein [Roseomonas sp. NAR14]|uniref:CoA-binding protein n=1 Tax=Roseomonas acroporae TaxID=2937791 RepID=A0A9X1Y348_9PROT|nr:CoA-binding protein [Roseomonas acroporae]MCK8783054.1 CoA-binding protein [Roseomonas acroporae]